MEILAEASSAKARTATAGATGVTVLKEEWRAAIISRERSENSFFKEGELEKGNCPVIRNFMICMGLFPFFTTRLSHDYWRRDSRGNLDGENHGNGEGIIAGIWSVENWIVSAL